MGRIYTIEEEEDRSLTKQSTQSEEQHGNAFPSASISVHQWLDTVFPLFGGFGAFRG